MMKVVKRTRRCQIIESKLHLGLEIPGQKCEMYSFFSVIFAINNYGRSRQMKNFESFTKSKAAKLAELMC